MWSLNSLLLRWCIPIGALSARGVPNESTKGPLPYQDLPPQHRWVSNPFLLYLHIITDLLKRQTWSYLLGHSQRRVNLVQALHFRISFYTYGFSWLRIPVSSTDKWSPALQIRTVLLSIQALLSSPNPDDPLATDVAKHYKENEKDAQRVSREWTEKYASAW